MRALVVRFSALGDVALTMPALMNVLENNAELSIDFVSKPFTEPLFANIERLTFHPADLNVYKGLIGQLRFAASLRRTVKPDMYVDLHGSLRSRLIGLYFFFRGVKTHRIDKGRRQKQELTRKYGKKLRPLKHTVDRYLDVFEQARLKVSRTKRFFLPSKTYHKLNGPSLSGQVIGFAPFAGLPLKELPELKAVELIEKILAAFPSVTLLLFSGYEEKERQHRLIQKLSNKSPSSKLFSAHSYVSNFSEELALIAKLKVMIGMDSANLHLAALAGTPVIGIYGTTHPFLGFSPYGQEFSGTVGVDSLSCRPCTVYGNGFCYRKDFACMNELNLDLIVHRLKMLTILNQKLS